MNYYQSLSRLLKPHIPDAVKRWEVIWQILDLMGSVGKVERAIHKFIHGRSGAWPIPISYLEEETGLSGRQVSRILIEVLHGNGYDIDTGPGHPPLVRIVPEKIPDKHVGSAWDQHDAGRRLKVR